MKWIRGDKLCYRNKALVLNAFGYRWTHENIERARYWFGKDAPTIQPVSDEQWLIEHCFPVCKNGTLSKRMRHARPACLYQEVDQ